MEVFFMILSALAIVAVLLIRIEKMERKYVTDKLIDSKTDMGNLEFFKYHFKNTISDASRNLYYIAYINLDSSYLRSYYGDSFFEDVLKYTASVLTQEASDNEIAARVRENGFAFAFQPVSDEGAKKRIERIMNRLNNFEYVEEKPTHLVFSGALYHLGNGDKNCELLLFNLRQNCKRIYGTEKQFIYCDVNTMNRVQGEKKITQSILRGLDNNEFKMYLQFIVDNKTKKIVSAEALSRWDRGEDGVVGPGGYIEDMETTGLISRHDFYMFERVCRQLERWSDTEYKDISISCNFTRITLSEENFIDKITEISNSYSFDKSKIAIEMTEDDIEKDIETATQNVSKCKELGFKIYLDDLGSGYTSLANLCDYPIDIVKIDRDILLKTNTKKGKDLFAGIIALAHSLNTKVICEGVETEEQDVFVSTLDCDYIQGWYYSKPVSSEEYEAFLQEYNMPK